MRLGGWDGGMGLCLGLGLVVGAAAVEGLWGRLLGARRRPSSQCIDRSCRTLTCIHTAPAPGLAAGVCCWWLVERHLICAIWNHQLLTPPHPPRQPQTTPTPAHPPRPIAPSCVGTNPNPSTQLNQPQPSLSINPRTLWVWVSFLT